MRGDHLSDTLLIGVIDDELNQLEAHAVESHLAVCHECARRRQQLRHLSTGIESAIDDAPVAFHAQHRETLERELEARELAAAQRSSPALRRLSWSMAIAAALAFAVLFIPQKNRAPKLPRSASQPVAFEIDGERFVALPYSNPDLPFNASHIVQMQVPVSALADAGVVFEPISNEFASTDRLVRADVLLGIDGQPLGVHILSNDVEE
jgi:hypothetical protein